MATYISTADGNFTSASTWAQVEPGTGAIQTTISTLTNTTTTYVYSSAFTGTNTNVCDGIMLYCRRAATGTVSVALSDDNGVTATRSVTVNATDLPVNGSWVFFKFATTLTLDGGVDYKVGVRASASNNATFFRDATTGNWARYLRLTAVAAAAPTTADVLFVVGEYTAAATSTARTVTMDSTAATEYGAITICPRGTLAYGTSAATNYVLRLAGFLTVNENATLNIGTSGTPIPRGSTAVLEFVCTTAAQYGLDIIGTANVYGSSRTSGKDIVACKLSADAAVAATSLTVDTDTGWLSGDQIAIAPTARTATQYEDRTLNANATATTLTVSSGLTNAHSGTTPTQGEIGLLTRNVIIRATASAATNATFVRTYAPTSVANFYWAELYYLGSTTTSLFAINADAGTTNMYYCSLHDLFFRINFNSTTACTMSNCVIYKSGTSTASYAMSINNGSHVITNNLFIGVSSNSNYGVYWSSTIHIFNNNVIAGSSASSGAFGTFNSAGMTGSMSGNVIHSNAIGPVITNKCVVDNLTSYRNGNYGLNLSNRDADITIQSSTFFGNTTGSINCSSNLATITLIDCVSYSESSFTTPSGLILAAGALEMLNAYNCDFSPVGKTAHTYDVRVSPTGTPMTGIANFFSCYFGAATEFLGQSALGTNSRVTSSNHDKTAGAYKALFQNGTISRDTTIFNTAAPSERLTPTNSNFKLASGSRVAAIDSSGTLTVSVYIRKSTAGDGAAYNGNQPRLIVKRNDAVGITADTVLATYTGSTGAWAQISGTTATASDDGALEFYVDCDGFTGWINVDDWSVT